MHPVRVLTMLLTVRALSWSATGVGVSSTKVHDHAAVFKGSDHHEQHVCVPRREAVLGQRPSAEPLSGARDVRQVPFAHLMAN